MNHFMMGHIENLLIPDLLGIKRRGELIEVAPHPVGDLTWCKGSTMSRFGPVQVEWKKESGKFLLDIDIPTDGYAEVLMPFSGKKDTIGDGHHHFEEPLVVKSQRAKGRSRARVRTKAKSQTVSRAKSQTASKTKK